MAGYKVRVSEKEGIFDAIGQGILKDVRDLAVKGVSDVRFGIFYITLRAISMRPRLSVLPKNC